MTVQQASAKLLVHQAEEIFERQKAYSRLLRTEPVANRKARLKAIRSWIHRHKTQIHKAAYADFQKPAQEVDAIEIFHVLNEINVALAELDQWTRPKKVDAPLTMLGTRSFIQYEPKGVCLIISPWNYPFSLAIGPLVSALAAGNSAILKPSEQTPNVAALLSSMCKELFDEKVVAVFEGDASVSQALLRLPFDHIFFTGSPSVGKVVMKAAAEHLTSVTLELGGKSPCIVTADANLNDAAERIIVAKFVNNGQTCIAPDYILAEESIASILIQKLVEKVRLHFAGEDDFHNSPSYCRIVNSRHHARLEQLLDNALAGGATVHLTGEHQKMSNFFHPVILSNVSAGSRILEEEIFGPILPVITYSNLDDALTFINDKPKPLALYLFGNKTATQRKVLLETSAGGVCINDCGIHFLNHGLPFGGVNNSGMGKSHGHYGFLAFSHEKPVLKQKSGITSVKLFYPPYTNRSRKIMDWFLKFF